QPFTSSFASSNVRRVRSPVDNVRTYTSPLPVRVDVKARRDPSGEYIGRESAAGCDTSSRASPPREGTSQMSPPLANAIVEPSGEIPGSANEGFADSWAIGTATERTTAANNSFFI